ncbi:hypothetical protein [Desulfosediminicola ganghwensis]|uniref:hypothetical protein n=1 Tax=Desulfosediminicola ganghwensis TaxID=2569540 RepID=UPI0010ACDACE|nr:hypothetical protein [Desulfosediminicola ganghwensis]
MTNNKHEEWLGNFLYDKWQRLRRHPDYRGFCRRNEKLFDDLGVAGNYFDEANPDDAKDNPDDAALQQLRERFHIAKIYHHDLDLRPSDLLQLPQIFTGQPAISPVFVEEEDDCDKFTDFTVVHNDMHIDCRINISTDITDDELTQSLLELVRCAREEAGLKDNPRHHFAKNRDAYHIYDLRLQRVPFSRIARETGFSKDSAFKKFCRAWELIHGEPYDLTLLTQYFDLNSAERGKWDRVGEAKSSRKEYLAHTDEHGRQKILDNYQGEGVDAATEKRDLRESLSHLRAYCQKCKDTTCSHGMTKALDKGLTHDELDFSGLTPCPELYHMLRTGDYPIL